LIDEQIIAPPNLPPGAPEDVVIEIEQYLVTKDTKKFKISWKRQPQVLNVEIKANNIDYFPTKPMTDKSMVIEVPAQESSTWSPLGNQKTFDIKIRFKNEFPIWGPYFTEAFNRIFKPPKIKKIVRVPDTAESMRVTIDKYDPANKFVYIAYYVTRLNLKDSEKQYRGSVKYTEFATDSTATFNNLQFQDYDVMLVVRGVFVDIPDGSFFAYDATETSSKVTMDKEPQLEEPGLVW
jgi:hypothetical protein